MAGISTLKPLYPSSLRDLIKNKTWLWNLAFFLSLPFSCCLWTPPFILMRPLIAPYIQVDHQKTIPSCLCNVHIALFVSYMIWDYLPLYRGLCICNFKTQSETHTRLSTFQTPSKTHCQLSTPNSQSKLLANFPPILPPNTHQKIELFPSIPSSLPNLTLVLSLSATIIIPNPNPQQCVNRSSSISQPHRAGTQSSTTPSTPRLITEAQDARVWRSHLRMKSTWGSVWSVNKRGMWDIRRVSMLWWRIKGWRSIGGCMGRCIGGDVMRYLVESKRGRWWRCGKLWWTVVERVSGGGLVCWMFCIFEVFVFRWYDWEGGICFRDLDNSEKKVKPRSKVTGKSSQHCEARLFRLYHSQQMYQSLLAHSPLRVGPRCLSQPAPSGSSPHSNCFHGEWEILTVMRTDRES